MKTQRGDRMLGYHPELTLDTIRTAELSALCIGHSLPQENSFVLISV